MPAPRPRLTPAQIRDAAYTQIAIASVAYAEQRIALVRMLAAGRDHGLTPAELAEASGRPEAFVAELLQEA
jgi:hypothetical protein